MLQRCPNPFQLFKSEIKALPDDGRHPSREMYWEPIVTSQTSTSRVQAYRERNRNTKKKNRLRCWRVYLLDETIDGLNLDIGGASVRNSPIDDEGWKEAVSKKLRQIIEAEVNPKKS